MPQKTLPLLFLAGIGRDLNLLIHSLKQLDNMPRIVIVDDCSFPPLENGTGEIIHLRERRGVSIAKNIGLALCKTKYIWFLDSDTTIINPGMLHIAQEYFEADEGLAGIGGEIYQGKDGRKYLCENIMLPDYSTFRWLKLLKKPVIKKARIISTCNIIMRAEALRKIGGFCPRLTIHEDKLACFQLQKMGYTLVVNSNLAVLHHLSQAGRIGEEYFWNEYASNLAFVFGALSNRIEIKMFPLYTLVSRIVEFLGAPKLFYDYIRIN